jgi:hypothetical protein
VFAGLLGSGIGGVACPNNATSVLFTLPVEYFVTLSIGATPSIVAHAGADRGIRTASAGSRMGSSWH